MRRWKVIKHDGLYIGLVPLSSLSIPFYFKPLELPDKKHGYILVYHFYKPEGIKVKCRGEECKICSILKLKKNNKTNKEIFTYENTFIPSVTEVENNTWYLSLLIVNKNFERNFLQRLIENPDIGEYDNTSLLRVNEDYSISVIRDKYEKSFIYPRPSIYKKFIKFINESLSMELIMGNLGIHDDDFNYQYLCQMLLGRD